MAVSVGEIGAASVWLGHDDSGGVVVRGGSLPRYWGVPEGRSGSVS